MATVDPLDETGLQLFAVSTFSLSNEPWKPWVPAIASVTVINYPDKATWGKGWFGSWSQVTICQNVKHLVTARVRAERGECMHVCPQLVLSLLYRVQDPDPGGLPTFTLSLLTSINITEIISNEHAHRPAWSRQPLTGTLFLGDSRWCHIDKNNWHSPHINQTQVSHFLDVLAPAFFWLMLRIEWLSGPSREVPEKLVCVLVTQASALFLGHPGSAQYLGSGLGNWAEEALSCWGDGPLSSKKKKLTTDE